MKKIIFFMAALLWAGTGNAADIKNTDAVRYDLLVKTADGKFKTVLEPNGFIAALCSNCTVEIVGYSLIDIENEKTIVVKDGVLKVKS